MSVSSGEISYASMVAAPISGLPSGSLTPFGWWDFQIVGLKPGETVQVTITFPSAIPLGSNLYKSDCGSADVFNANGIVNSVTGNTLEFSLTDGGAGDCDSVPGQITDPGGIVVTQGDSRPLGVPQFPLGVFALFVVALPLVMLLKRSAYTQAHS